MGRIVSTNAPAKIMLLAIAKMVLANAYPVITVPHAAKVSFFVKLMLISNTN